MLFRSGWSQYRGSVLACSMTMGALDRFDSMQSVDSRSSCPPAVIPKLISSLTTHAVQVFSVTRATAANLIPVDSHKTSSSVGTACNLLRAATSLAISSAESLTIWGWRGKFADKSSSLLHSERPHSATI